MNMKSHRLHLAISNGFVSFKIYDKRDDIDFVMIDFPFLDGIMQTCPCDVDPLTPHFYIDKVGFTGVYMLFLFLL